MCTYGSRMFERFTDRARRVIVLSQDAAREMGHNYITPAHLLVGLSQGDGMAARAMAEAGVDGVALRQRVAELYVASDAAKKMNKVPFSAEAKKSLEFSLREALQLGHSYIGTEHLFLGVQRHAKLNDQDLDVLLGVGLDQILGLLAAMLDGATSGRAMLSPALQAALGNARAIAGQSTLTTGQVLSSMLADPDSQVSHALAAIQIDPLQVQSALDEVEVAKSSDASPAPQNVTITIGDTVTVIADPDVANALRQLNAEQLQSLIRSAVAGAESKPVKE
jgi:ATP-dependent Clp protease ATP-binding subunit ClpA